MTAKRIAITGATGFLGQHVVQAIYDAGHIPIAVVRDGARARQILPQNIEITVADILDEEALITAFNNIDTAIHLAGMISVNKCDYENLEKINVQGAENFISAVRQTNVKRAIFTSTTSAVGALKHDQPDQALDETAFFNLEYEDIGYIRSKRAAHILALNAQDNDLPLIIISPSFMLGPYDINLNGANLIDAITRGALPICPQGGINPIDVRDVAKAYVEVINHPAPSRHYIVASKENISLKNFINYVAKLASVSPPALSLPKIITTNAAKIVETIFPEGELTEDGANMGCFYWYFNAALARRELSLDCRPLEETIKATLTWLKNHEMEIK